MSKGTRKRQAYQEAQIALQEKQEKEKIEKRKGRMIYIIIAIIFAIILLVTIAGTVVANQLKENGYTIRHQKIMSSEHYTIDGAMMTYNIHSEYNNYCTKNSDNLESVGLDITKSMKEQTCTLVSDIEQTWFEYFATSAQNHAYECLATCEAALAAGYSLPQDKIDEIESEIAGLEDDAKSNNMEMKEYLKTNFGQGVSIEDIRNSLMLQKIAVCYKEDYISKIKLTDEDIQEHSKDAGKYYNSCDYYTITFVSSVSEDMTQEQIDSYNDSSMKWAQGLADCHSVEAFEAYLTTYFTQYYEERNMEYTDETIRNQIDTTASIVKDYTYSDTELGNWALDDERKVGDTKIIQGDNQYEVYMIVTAPHPYSYATKNIRAIWFSINTYINSTAANSKAREVLAEWKKGDMTEDSFAELAAKYTDDLVAKQNGGLMDNCLKENIDESLGKWAFDEKREYGDYSIISQNDSGNYLAFYIGDGEDSKFVISKDIAKESIYKEAYSTWQVQYKVSIDATKFDKLPA